MKISEAINKEQLAYDIAETWGEYGAIKPIESVVFDMLEKWEENKQGLFEKFGNKLTIETSFQPSSQLNLEEKQIQLTSMLREKANKIQSTNYHKNIMYKIMANMINDDGLLENMINNRALNLKSHSGIFDFYRILNLIMGDTDLRKEQERVLKLFNKKTKCTIVCLPEIIEELIEENIFYSASPKLTKQIVNAATILEYKEKNIHDFISILSEIQASKTKENTGEEKLILSIHPMDYITMSINDSNWSSCVHPDDGNSGTNFSAMVDSSTFVAYVPRRRSKIVLHHKQPDVVWNDKKWRVLCHFDEKLKNVAMNQQYPHDNETIFANLRRLMRKQWGLEYSIAPDFIHHGATNITTIADSMYFDGVDAYFVESQEVFPIYLNIGEDIRCLECGGLLDIQDINIRNDGFCAYCADREDELEREKICCGECEICKDQCG